MLHRRQITGTIGTVSCFRNHIGTGSNEQDLAGRLNNNFEISSSVTGSNDVSGGTSRGRMSGGAAEAVLTRIVATLLLK